jgi:antitoxin ChpS
MHVTHLRKVGGSIMVALPPALLDMLDLRPGATVGIAIEDSRLIVVPSTRPHYTLDELLAQCDPAAEPTPEDREWLDGKPVGDELL